MSAAARGHAGCAGAAPRTGRGILENVAARVLYFHNTIDTHCLLMTALGLGALGALSMLGWVDGIAWATLARPAAILHAGALVAALLLALKWCDFFPPILLAAGPVAVVLSPLAGGRTDLVLWVLGVNLALFVVSHMMLFGGPYVVIFGAWSSPLRGLWYSLFTLAPTTASFWICQFCTNVVTFAVLLRPEPSRPAGLLFLGSIAAAVVAARLVRPRSRMSPTFLPPPGPPVVRRVLLLSVDGLSLNLMRRARTPFFDRLAREWASAPAGAVTVYRALTNPAFASMMTGVPPEVHTMRDNNLGNRIAVEGLPDYVPARIYGSIHMRHFAKPHWDVRVVPITREGFATDDVLVRWLLEDLEGAPDLRLFVVDLSTVDMTAHAFGARTRHYIRAIEETDRRLDRLFAEMERRGVLDDTTVILSSDHGQSCLDHSFLLNDDEKYVPLVLCGAGIRRGATLGFRPSITDFAPTIAWLLGVPYPGACRARVLAEAIESAPVPDRAGLDAGEAAVAASSSAGAARSIAAAASPTDTAARPVAAPAHGTAR